MIQKNNFKIQWYLIDAKEQNLGRLSSKIAHNLIGKTDKHYLPFRNNKIKVIVINSAYIKVTGKKNQQKLYKRHSGKPGGLKQETFSKLKSRLPHKIIEHSVQGMLPKNNLGKHLARHLKVYEHNAHPHEAQKPISLNID